MSHTTTTDWPGVAQSPGLVSVIIPSHNRATLLPLTLDSIFNQTYRPIEVLVVDDASTDGTPEAVEQWAAAHATDPAFALQLLRREKRGAPAARNEGAALSQGEFIQFFDSDDLMRPEKLAKSVAALQARPELDFVVCDFVRFHEKEGNLVSNTTAGEYSKREKTLTAYINQPCLNTHAPVFRRKSLCAVGPWAEDLTVWQDFEYGFRVLAALKGDWLGEVLYDIRVTRDSISDTSAKKDGRQLGESYIRACVRVEEKALAQGIPLDVVQQEMGKKLQKQAYYFAGKKRWDAYDVISKAAANRLDWISRMGLIWHRLRLKIRGKY